MPEAAETINQLPPELLREHASISGFAKAKELVLVRYQNRRGLIGGILGDVS